MTNNLKTLLILCYSVGGSTKGLASYIARGARKVNGIEVKLRTVAKVSPDNQASEPAVPHSGDPYCSLEELAGCHALALGSPTRFGNMAAPLKYFIDGTANLWANGALEGKPAAVFTSSSSLHGGQESTLLSMMLPLLHHGMLITGVPYSEHAIRKTTTGGTPYGPSHYESHSAGAQISAEEKSIAMALGERLANLTIKLKQT